MNPGWITLNLIHTKYYIDIDMDLLKWLMISMNIFIYIGIGIGQWIMIYKYGYDMLWWLLTSNFIWYLVLKKNMENGSPFRPPEYAPDRSYGKFWQTKYFAVYAAKTHSMIVDRLGMLQPLFFKQLPGFLKYNKHRNTYEHIVM